MDRQYKNIEEKSIAVDTAMWVTAIGAAVPAGKIIGGVVRQIIDNVKKGDNKVR